MSTPHCRERRAVGRHAGLALILATLHLVSCARGGDDGFVGASDPSPHDAAMLTVSQSGSSETFSPDTVDRDSTSEAPDGSLASVEPSSWVDAPAAPLLDASALEANDSVDSNPLADASELEADVETGDVTEASDPGSGPAAPPLPALGELMITEVMFDPWGPRPDAEWFEVYNGSGADRSLGGLLLVDGEGRKERIAMTPPVIAPSGRYLLFVRSAQAAAQQGLPASAIVYDYGAGLSAADGIQLESGDSGGISIWSGQTELAAVTYGEWNADWQGQSLELGVLRLVGSDDPANWCIANTPWGLDSDDGTPGLPNDCQ